MFPVEPEPGRRRAALIRNLFFLLATVLVSGWVIGTYMEVKADREIFQDPKEVPAIDAIVVPGASVHRSGRLSPVLMQRMDAAIGLAAGRPGVKLVLSGYAVPKGYSETKAMRDYALEKSFPARDVILDENGKSTFLTLLNCKKSLHLRRVALVSQRYHLPRALYIARRLGLSGYGLVVDSREEEGEWHGREWASRLKDFVLVRVFRFFHAN